MLIEGCELTEGLAKPLPESFAQDAFRKYLDAFQAIWLRWARQMESAIMSPFSATFYHFETGKKIKATMGKVDQDCH